MALAHSAKIHWTMIQNSFVGQYRDSTCRYWLQLEAGSYRGKYELLLLLPFALAVCGLGLLILDVATAALYFI